MIIQIIQRENGLYSCHVDGLVADMLTKDEALGVVASALFAPGLPLYVRSYESWVSWEERYNNLDRKAQKLLCETNKIN